MTKKSKAEKELQELCAERQPGKVAFICTKDKHPENPNHYAGGADVTWVDESND